MIFDEDLNEEVSYDDYIDTLDAYGALREEDYIAQDGRLSVAK